MSSYRFVYEWLAPLLSGKFDAILAGESNWQGIRKTVFLKMHPVFRTDLMSVLRTSNLWFAWAGTANLRKKRCLTADAEILPKS